MGIGFMKRSFENNRKKQCVTLLLSLVAEAMLMGIGQTWQPRKFHSHIAGTVSEATQAVAE